MLSIGAMGSGQGNYYIGLANGDYYHKGGEPQGIWLGKGAKALGLTGLIERESFLRVFHGFDPHSDQALLQNAGDKNHQPGWDLTFSAPKSISTLWAVLSPEMRKAIEEAHFAALKEAVSYLEEQEAFTRRGKGGKIHEPVKLVVASFEHGTSRAQDPQLHTHCLVMNVGIREDGTRGTILSKPLYKAKMLTGALYRAELSRRLQSLGFTVVQKGTTFEIVGVPPALMEEFSKRRTEIEKVLSERGQDSAKAASIAALNTRQVKEHVAREILFPEWQETANRHGMTQESAEQLRQFVPFKQQSPEDIDRINPLDPFDRIRHDTKSILESALARLSQQVSHFSEREFLRAVFEEAQSYTVSTAHLRAAVSYQLETGKLVTLGEQKGEIRYTTPELYALEKQLLTSVKALHVTPGFSVSKKALQKAIAQTEEQETTKAQKSDPDAQRQIMNDEQRKALSHLTEDRHSIAVVSGMAGTGKTFLLQAARVAWEQEGYQVLGTAVAGKAARGLDEGAGIKSVTIARLLMELERRSPQIFLNARTILVADEAGMIGTRQMEALTAACQKAGSKLILIGDARQLQPVDVGGPFHAIQERIGKVELSQIVRQEVDAKDKNPFWRREAVRAFADGRAGDAIRAYAERGFLNIGETRAQAMKALIEKWSAQGLNQAKDNLIFAGTRTETRELNHAAQQVRRAAGKLGFRSVTTNSSTYFEKDRVLITENHTRLDVSNGDLGTIERIDPNSRRLHVTFDDGRNVSLPWETFKGFSLGYALTTHKGQGVTVKNAFVMCGGSMSDRELTYVQASRARQNTHFFTGAIHVWDERENKQAERTIPELSRLMSRSRQKDLAHDVERHNLRQRATLELLPVQ